MSNISQVLGILYLCLNSVLIRVSSRLLWNLIAMCHSTYIQHHMQSVYYDNIYPQYICYTRVVKVKIKCAKPGECCASVDRGHQDDLRTVWILGKCWVQTKWDQILELNMRYFFWQGKKSVFKTWKQRSATSIFERNQILELNQLNCFLFND